MYEIRVVRNAEELAALQPQWWQLWRRTAAPSFLSPSWLLPWWRIFHPGELCTLCVFDAGRLVALAALLMEAESSEAPRRPCASWDAPAFHLTKSRSDRSATVRQ
jgi:CelD/BcsL family acetyltransferase involved in cellulose biosynthesis